MGGGHHAAAVHRLFVPGDSAVHRSAPEAKLVALVVFVSAVALTPRHAVWAFAADGAVLLAVAAVARIPVGVLARRALVVAPFLAVAALVPVIGDGPRTNVGPFELSTDGLWAAWNIAAKALLGATASIVLTATTPIPALLTGMTRLRVPRPVVAIVSFMVRYLDLIADQLHRMRLAAVARGHDPRWLWQARPIAAAAGTLFVRTYERGERIHHAMVARGFTGHLPDLDPATSGRSGWLLALTAPAVAVAATIAALVST
jgi:cobalt/nickel transport system permease protein